MRRRRSGEFIDLSLPSFDSQREKYFGITGLMSEVTTLSPIPQVQASKLGTTISLLSFSTRAFSRHKPH